MLANAEAGRALASLDARPVDSGWNLAVQETRSAVDLAQAEMVDDLRLAKPLQVRPIRRQLPQPNNMPVKDKCMTRCDNIARVNY